MKCLRSLALAFTCFLAPLAPAQAQQAAPDYGIENNWLCKAGRMDACAIDINATSISRSGTQTIVPFVRTQKEKPVDCFYVYPTVSLQNSDISNLVQESAQFARVRTQLARYGNACRLFAPMYGQLTLKAMGPYATDLKAFDPNTILAAAPPYQSAYRDVVAAWKHYLANDNKGRGVILIGHSQGSFILRDLIKAEIDGKADQAKLVSAHLAGVVIANSSTDMTKQEFQSLHACSSGSQTGCFISYSSFPADSPPPSWNKGFGVSNAPGTINNCSNPAELSGDDGVLIPYIDATRKVDDTQNDIKWAAKSGPVSTPLVTLPNFFKAKCVTREDGTGYLAIGFVSSNKSKDVRNRYVPGHLYIGPTLLSNWGTHDADLEFTIGNLIKVAASQGAAWQKSHPGQ